MAPVWCPMTKGEELCVTTFSLLSGFAISYGLGLVDRVTVITRMMQMSAGDHADDTMSARSHPSPPLNGPAASGSRCALLTGPRACGGVLR